VVAVNTPEDVPPPDVIVPDTHWFAVKIVQSVPFVGRTPLVVLILVVPDPATVTLFRITGTDVI
jgi:hypothetical protein